MTTVLTEKDHAEATTSAAGGMDFDPAPQQESERSGVSRLDVSHSTRTTVPLQQQHLDEIDVVPIMTASHDDLDETRPLLTEVPKVVVVNNNTLKAPAGPRGTFLNQYFN